MKRFIPAAIVAALLAVPAAASAAQPTDPGCFGRDRSDNIHTYWTNDGYGVWGLGTDQAKGVGIDGASDRAGTNGANNAAYKAAYCA